MSRMPTFATLDARSDWLTLVWSRNEQGRIDMKFSANLGFLWCDLPLPDAIRAAHAAGFDAVECHWPYQEPVAGVIAALEETGLPMLGLNTRKGDNGEHGLAAMPGRQADTRAMIDEACDYADAIGAGAIHVMAGLAQGPEAEATFLENLSYATARTERMILIEPLNHYDTPGYFLNTTAQAADLIAASGKPNLRMMFDCYHVGRTEGDVVAEFTRHHSMIGHIQIASVPDRGAPDHGEVSYAAVFEAIANQGWDRPLGAEYRAGHDVAQSLAWMHAARKI